MISKKYLYFENTLVSMYFIQCQKLMQVKVSQKTNTKYSV